MRIFGRIFLCLLLLLFGSTTALADPSDIKEVPCPDDFSVISINLASDDTFLLTGGTGDVMNPAPMLLNFDLNGEIIWSLQADKEVSNLFRGVMLLEEGSYIALGTKLGSQNAASALFFIEEGQVARQTEPMIDSFGLYLASDGFLIDGAPDFTSTRISRMDIEGKTLWQIDFNEEISFKGIVSKGGVYVAYGSKTIREDRYDHPPIGVVIAFDDHGSVLWRHDSPTTETYSDAVWTDQGSVILAGNVDGSTDAQIGDENYWGHSFIAEYNEQGQVRRTDTRGEGIQIALGSFKSIIPFLDGYLVSATVRRAKSEMKMLYFDREGNLQRQWNESLGNVYTYQNSRLMRVKGEAYLVAHGYVETEESEDWESVVGVPYCTIVKKVDLP